MKIWVTLSILISFVVAIVYRKHEFGFWGVLLACLLTTPMVGWIIINVYEFKDKWQRRDENVDEVV